MLHFMILIFFGLTDSVALESPLPEQITRDNFHFSYETGNLIMLRKDLKSIAVFQPFNGPELVRELKPDLGLNGADYAITSINELYIDNKDYTLLNVTIFDKSKIQSYLLSGILTEEKVQIYPIVVESSNSDIYNTGIRNLDQIDYRFIANTQFLRTEVHNGIKNHVFDTSVREVTLRKNEDRFTLAPFREPFQSRGVRPDSVTSFNTSMKFFGSDFNDDLLMISALDPRVQTFGFLDGHFSRTSMDIELTSSGFKPAVLANRGDLSSDEGKQAWWDSFSKLQGATEIESGSYLIAYTTPRIKQSPEQPGSSLVLETIDRSGKLKRQIEKIPGAFFLSANTEEAYVLQVDPKTNQHRFRVIPLSQ